jgi:thioesterase domain-containing protein
VNERELEQFMHEQIPLSRAMQLRVLVAGGNGVTLEAPLAPNINHHETVFGGSASALAILAAWALVHVRLRESGRDHPVVIRRDSIAYERPMAGTFTARAGAPKPVDWELFLRTLDRHGRARIIVRALLECDGVRAGELEGEFVAIAPPPGQAR